jgi:hypothetical protein
MMEPLAVLSLGHATVQALQGLPMLQQNSHVPSEVQRISYETELLRSIVEDASFDLDRLHVPPPRSALKAMEQCASVSYEMAILLSPFKTNSILKQVALTSIWLARKPRISEVLDTFRAVAGFLREITAEYNEFWGVSWA